MICSWSIERDNELRKHHAAGLSFTVMAELLHVSRSAIAGKCARLNLVRNDSAAAANGRLGGKAARRRTLKFNFTRRRVVAGPPCVKVAAVVSVPPPDAPPPISFEELETHHCRWPIGDPKEADFAYCGQEKQSGSYCDYHTRIAHQPRRDG